MTRREAGWITIRAAAAAGGVDFFAAWLKAASGSAAQHAHNDAAPPEPDRWRDYQPVFFSAEEFQMLDAFTALLIPTDETPGAREAHVAPYIDFVVNAATEYAPEMQDEWREAMKWLHARQFGKLSEERQIALLEEISAPERDHSQKHQGYPVYRLIKDMTIEAFYTSRVGLIDVLEYKGNAYLAEFPGCTHPEHRKV